MRGPGLVFCTGEAHKRVRLKRIKTLLLLVLPLLAGCTVVSYDRAFPKLTWAWTDQAKEQRRQNREHAAGEQAYKDSLRTNAPANNTSLQTKPKT